MQPRAGRREVWKDATGAVRVALCAPPEGGRANEELVELVAELFGVSRSKVELWKGGKSRQKVLRLNGVDAGQFEKKLGELKTR